MNESVNAAICEAFDKKIIDRTTLLVNMPHAKEAMELAKEKGFADRVGLHLNLTSGRPLTDEMAADPVMCNSIGEYTADFARNMKTRFCLPKETAANVSRELAAQFDEYAKLGGTLWHVDSHHHVHTDPSIWKILKKQLKDRPVTSVRLSRNMYRGGNLLMRIYKMILNASIRKFGKKRRDLFGSMPDYESFTSSNPDIIKDNEIEIMVHPVYDKDGNLCDAYGDKMYRLARP